MSSEPNHAAPLEVPVRDPSAGPAGDVAVAEQRPDRARSRRRGTTPLRRITGRIADLGYLLPVLLLVVGVIAVPGVSALYHSFTDWEPGYPSPWVGLANYTHLLGSATFREILLNQGVFLLGVPLWTVLPLAMALILYEGAAGAGIFRTIYFFPAVLSPAIVGILFRTVLADDGLVNEVLRAVGLGSLAQGWVENPHLVKPTLIVVLAWANVGIGIVIFSAALSAMPIEVLEAAHLDGAGWLQRLRYIVLPMMAPTIALWVVFQVINVFVAIFSWIYVLTAGGPGYSSTTIDYDIYQNAFRNGFFGLAAAESVLLLVIVSLIAVIGYRLRKRRTAAVRVDEAVAA